MQHIHNIRIKDIQASNINIASYITMHVHAYMASFINASQAM